MPGRGCLCSTGSIPGGNDPTATRGTCCEHTPLYAAALESIGFTFTATASRVRMNEDHTRPATHASLRVELDGEEWFTDVGFGAESPRAPLRLKDGEVVRQDGWFDLYAIGTEPRFCRTSRRTPGTGSGAARSAAHGIRDRARCRGRRRTRRALRVWVRPSVK
ncbi:arylamine N-acetyltransferase [Streptomyces rimosus]|uniref:arylamine N-acetyltransferase n=1 Tax=Streptomyces rimosus TaxID=1927 RepID=UPI00099CED05|nr:arylamine N-acetyltransferase [Streptomyces rimosus]